MFYISELMKNLILFGHTKIYKPNPKYPNENHIITLYIDNNSNLIIDEGTSIFDRPFWDGFVVDEKAIETRTYTFFSYNKYSDMLSFITALIVSGFYNYGTYQMADEVYDLNDNDETLSKIYDYIMAALDIDNSMLYKMFSMEKPDIAVMLMKNALKKQKKLPFSKELAPKLIEKKWDDLFKRFHSIEAIIQASEETLPVHTKTLLNKTLKRISIDNTSKTVDIHNYTKRRH